MTHAIPTNAQTTMVERRRQNDVRVMALSCDPPPSDATL